MPEAISTPNLVALLITSQELGRGGGLFCPPTKIGLSNSPTTVGLKAQCSSPSGRIQDYFLEFLDHCSSLFCSWSAGSY